MADLTRNVILYLYANGALTFAPKSDRRKPQGALPVYSVDTVEEARKLQIMLCSLSKQDNETYFLPFSEKVEDIPKVSEMLHLVYVNWKNGVTGQSLVAPFIRYKKELGLDALC